MLPLTGNVYKDKWSFEGVSYVDYSVDCSECGEETAIFLSFEAGKTCNKWLKNQGWHKHPEHHKWVCPECWGNLTKRAPDVCQSCGSKWTPWDEVLDSDLCAICGTRR